MSTMGTFGTFTQARLGIYAAMKGLSVTGNNISNINTTGYTRQVLNQVSMRNGGADRYASKYDVKVGNGVLCTSLSQIRDPYLDIRFRAESAEVGYYDEMLSGLNELASILDEVGSGEDDNGIFQAQLNDLADKLIQLGNHAGQSGYDTIVRKSADTLCTLFHTYANKLETLRNNTEAGLRKDVTEINGILTDIRKLNTAIRKGDIHGDSGLELRDERNNLIDKLSQYLKIKVTYSMEDLGAGQQVEKLTIQLDNANSDDTIHTDEAMLVDGIYCTQLTTPDGVKDNGDLIFNDNYDLSLTKLYDDKGREWTEYEGVTTEIIPAKPPTIPAQAARYEIPITSSGWADNDTFTINGQTIRIMDDGSGDITSSDANDPAKLAALIANTLSDPDYSVTANNGSLVFTAKNAGAIGSGNAPAAAPAALADITGGTGTIQFGSVAETQAGRDRFDPDDPVITDNGDGTFTRSETTYTSTKDGNVSAATTSTRFSKEVNLDDNDLYGSLQAARELLTEEGEFASAADIARDETAATKRGIPYYRKSMDLLAQKFAKEFNSYNMQYMVNAEGYYVVNPDDPNPAGAPVDKDGCLLDGAGNKIKSDHEPTAAELAILKQFGSEVSLFSNRNDNNDTDGITAANISISHAWSTGAAHVVTTKEYPLDKEGDIPQTTQCENVNHMINLIDRDLVYNPSELEGVAPADVAVSNHLTEGSFQEMLDNMCSILGGDQNKFGVRLDTHYTTAVELDTGRDSVSGVDLNDEAMNMIQYQKAYTAACRLMTTIDEALERLISGTAV